MWVTGSNAAPGGTMARNPYDNLSRRERQIMDILIELGEASAGGPIVKGGAIHG